MGAWGDYFPWGGIRLSLGLDILEVTVKTGSGKQERETRHQGKEAAGGLGVGGGPNPDSVLTTVCSFRPLSHEAPEMMNLGDKNGASGN